MLTPGAAANSIKVTRAGTVLGTFASVTNVAVYGDGGADNMTVNGVSTSANVFTLTGNVATLTPSAAGWSTDTITLNSITQVTLKGSNRGGSFTNTAATVASVLSGGTGNDTYRFAGSTMGAAATIADAGGSNTMKGPNQANVWTINAANAGNLNGSFTFTAFASLTGGSSTDSFVFSDQKGVTGTIDGAAGTNRMDYSAYSTALYVNLRTNVASGTGGIKNILQVYGGGQNDVLVGTGTGVLLVETAGKNLLIGGGGQATLDSGSGQYIVIAGTTSYDTNATALKAIESFWATNPQDFPHSVAQLSGPGITGGYKLNASTDQHDNAGDTIALDSPNDWLFWRLAGANADTESGTPGHSTYL